MLIDTHSHIYDEAFDNDRKEVVERALAEGVERIGQRLGKYPSHVVVCVDRMESCEHSAFSAKHDLEKRFGIKIHPMVNAEDILHAMESGVISSEEHREKLKAYLAQYKGA